MRSRLRGALRGLRSTLLLALLAALPVGACESDAGGGEVDAGARAGADATPPLREDAVTDDRDAGDTRTEDAEPRDTDAIPPPVTEDVDWEPRVPAALAAPIPGAPLDRPAACGAEWISTVRGWIVAPGGAPVEGAKAQICLHLSPGDRLLCLRPGTTDADGVFTVEIPEMARCMTRAAMRVVLPDAGKATTYCGMPVAGAAPVLRLTDPYVLFQTRPAVALPPEGDELAMRPIAFDDGLVVDFTPDLFYSGGGDYGDLGGRRVPVDARGLCFLADEGPPDGLYGFYPEGSVEAPGFPVHIPNTTGLAPGTIVELSVLGGLDCRRPDRSLIPEATWERIGRGRVSEDGARIDSDPGVGLPCLTWLAYREVQ